MEAEGTFALLRHGGFTMAVLVTCSVIVVAIVAERWHTYTQFRRQFARARNGGGAADWFTGLVRLPLPAAPERATRRHEANLLRASGFLNARLALLATIGSLAPFIGLFGTVLGIMRAFEAISRERGAGIEVVGAGIAEALVNTAAGLLVAIIAVMCYNMFRTRAREVIDEIELDYLEHSPAAEEAG